MATLDELREQALGAIKKYEDALPRPPESPYIEKWKRAQLDAEVDHKVAKALDLARAVWQTCCKDYAMEFVWPPQESKDGLPKQLMLLIDVLRSIK